MNGVVGYGEDIKIKQDWIHPQDRYDVRNY